MKKVADQTMSKELQEFLKNPSKETLAKNPKLMKETVKVLKAVGHPKAGELEKLADKYELEQKAEIAEVLPEAEAASKSAEEAKVIIQMTCASCNASFSVALPAGSGPGTTVQATCPSCQKLLQATLGDGGGGTRQSEGESCIGSSAPVAEAIGTFFEMLEFLEIFGFFLELAAM